MTSTPPAALAVAFVDAMDEARGIPPEWAQALNVVGEAGEFAEAYRRCTGYARRPGHEDEVRDELADVVISAYVFACIAGLDLDAAIAEKGRKIMSRGFGVNTGAAAS